MWTRLSTSNKHPDDMKTGKHAQVSSTTVNACYYIDVDLRNSPLLSVLYSLVLIDIDWLNKLSGPGGGGGGVMVMREIFNENPQYINQ